MLKNKSTQPPRYLTKSRFKLGMECPTKLFYTGKKTTYADASAEDSFLMALAEGGFQVGELAKFMFCNDPVAKDLTIKELDYAIALEKTNSRLAATGKVVIAEAAFTFDNFFIRADIIVKEGKQIDLYEVKAKSWAGSNDFWGSKEKKPNAKWLPYLQDVAFQKYVLQKAFPDYTIKAQLLLANKDAVNTVEGLNQFFKIEKDKNGRPKVKIAEGIKQSSLGNIPLIAIDVNKECEWIYTNTNETFNGKELGFEELIYAMAATYEKDERSWSELGKKCKGCQFKNKKEGVDLKSGFIECWVHQTGLTEKELKKPLSFELWGGGLGSKSVVSEFIKNKKYFLTDLMEDDYFPKKVSENSRTGLSSLERRNLQVEKVRNNDSNPYLDIAGLRTAMSEIEAPFHFIDFETSMVAIPFHKGRKPYEAIAFQYSYHIMEADGSVRHESEYLSLETGFPNYDFVRALKKDLEGKSGTIFRYHSHENTYLCHIYEQLIAENDKDVPDKDALINFIQDITHKDKVWTGARDMQDLYKWVLRFYYSPHAKGSNSIKQILPAVINDSKFVREKYSQALYGTTELPSKNFSSHTWITEAASYDPYKTLPQVITGFENDELEEICEKLTSGIDELNNGGAAMTAYAYLQFTDMPAGERERIRKALLRYCELDTMAMVMIWEYWRDVCK